MGRGVRRLAGGIVGLVRLLREHGEAVEYDLIALGLRLDWLPSRRLTWRDLLVIVRQSPRGSAIRRAVDPWDAHTIDLEMLRASASSLSWLVWAKTKDGSKGRNIPKPIRFPWEPKPASAFPADALPIDVMAARLGWNRKGD